MASCHILHVEAKAAKEGLGEELEYGTLPAVLRSIIVPGRRVV